MHKKLSLYVSLLLPFFSVIRSFAWCMWYCEMYSFFLVVSSFYLLKNTKVNNSNEANTMSAGQQGH